MESRAESLTSSTYASSFVFIVGCSWVTISFSAEGAGRPPQRKAVLGLRAAARLVLFVRAALGAGEVDAEGLGGAEGVLVELADLDLRALLVDHLHVQAERLHLLDEHLEALGDSRLGDVLAL